jgi:hypothetical protein
VKNLAGMTKKGDFPAFRQLSPDWRPFQSPFIEIERGPGF